MDTATLLADPNALHLEAFVSHENSITVVVRSSQPSAACPACQQPSGSLHSNYVRNIADLPWHNVAVRLELHTRKFRCRNELCPRRVFCERLPNVAPAFARKTARLNNALTWLAFALGGEMGARTAQKLKLFTSGDTLLRRIRQYRFEEKPTVKVLGVDDFSFRRGVRFGTILVDLEKRQPIDLLPDREAETLKLWLDAHPEVEIISRDRASSYSDGATRGAPNAVQIADRFHLLQNATGVFEKTLRRNYKSLRAVLQPVETIVTQAPKKESAAEKVNSSPEAVYHLIKSDSPYHQEKQRLFDLIKQLQAQDLSINQIRQQIGRHHTTVSRYFHAADYFSTTRIRGCWKRKLITPFLTYLQHRWAEGCRNAKQLYDEIKEEGYRGSQLTVRRAMQEWRTPVPVLVAAPPPQLPSLKTLCWIFLKPPEKLSNEERDLRARLLKNSEETRHGLDLIEGFRKMLRNRKVEKLDGWLESARTSGLVEFTNFGRGLKRDEKAVRAALEYEWSNGQVEGQVNRLKLIKREMFGRAKFDLLRARVLHQF